MMDVAVFEAHVARLRRDRGSVVDSAYDRWPPRLRSEALAPLQAEVTLEPSDLERILSWNACYRAFRGWAVPWAIEDIVSRLSALSLGRPGFPKLGPCSWKEMPGFGYMAAGNLAPRMARAFLRQVGDRMAAVLHMFVETRCLVRLMVFEHIGQMLSPELRVYDGPSGVIVRERAYSGCGTSPFDRQALESWYAVLINDIDIQRFNLDVVAVGGSREFAVVDINPLSQIGAPARRRHV